MSHKQIGVWQYLISSVPSPLSVNAEFRLVTALVDVVKEWGPTHRLSPVIPVSDGRLGVAGNLHELADYLLFLGPINPKEILALDDEGNLGIWATFGAFNSLVSGTEDEVGEVCDWARSTDAGQIPFELWKRQGSEYGPVEICPGSGKSYSAESLEKLAAVPGPIELRSSVEELVAQASSALARGKSSFHDIVPEVEVWVKTYLEEVSGVSEEPTSRRRVYRILGSLIQLNAGFSRLTSQALSGTSPLLLTECHLGSQSLLGTGLANQALRCFVRFLEDRVAGRQIPERLAVLNDWTLSQALRSQNLPVPDVGELGFVHENDTSPVWDLDLFRFQVPELTPTQHTLCFFSGRDGFRSTLSTVSAALPSVTHCNARRWSLMTVTHELSHNLVRGVLSLLYPEMTNYDEDWGEDESGLPPYTVQDACEIYHSSIEQALPYLTVLGFYRLLFIDQVVALEWKKATTGTLKRPTVADFARAFHNWHHDIEEILTHVLDFKYFYDNSDKEYIKAIWSTWSVIPNIESRVSEYVVRTLCALMASYEVRGDISHVHVPAEAGKLRNVLQALQSDAEDTPYLNRAIDLLDPKRSLHKEIFQEVEFRLPLVRFGARVLFDENLARSLVEDRFALGKLSKTPMGYELSEGSLNPGRIQSPLRFLRAYTHEEDPDLVRSFWMLMTVRWFLESDA